MMKTKISSGHMVLSLTMGYAVIFNLVATSRYEFYPIEMITGAAFAVGIAMLVGTVIFFMGEPGPMNFNFMRQHTARMAASQPTGGLRTARRVQVAASA